MGKIMMRKIKGMSWMTKISLVLIFTLLLSSTAYFVAEALNKATNWNFNGNSTGWTAVNTGAGIDGTACGTTSQTGRTAFATFNYNAALSGQTAFQAISGTVNAGRYKGYIHQQVTIPGSGNVAVNGKLDVYGASATWRAASADGYVRMDLFDSANSAFVACLLYYQLPGANMAWPNTQAGANVSVPAGTYTLRVTIAYRNSGTVTATLGVDNIIVNSAPTGLAASAPADTKNASLSWTGSTSPSGPALRGTNPYQVYRGGAPLAFSSTYSYTDSNTTGNTSYTYTVTDFDANNNESPQSASVSILTRPDAPGTPTFTGVSGTSLTVNWTAPTGGATSYKVERALDSGGAPGVWGQVASGVTSPWTDNTVSGGNIYWYRVRGANATGDGVYSGSASVATGNPPSVVSGPTLSATPPYMVTASHVPSPFHVNAVFNDNGSAITTCEYNTGAGWLSATKTGAGASTNCDADPVCTNGAALTIQMRATSPGGLTATSSLSRTCDTAAPTGLTASSPPDEAIDQPLNVSVVSTTADDSGGSGGIQYWFQVVDTETYNVNSGWIAGTSYAPAGLQNGTTYTWQVKARDAAGNETGWTTPRSFITVAECFRNDPSLEFTGSSISTLTVDGGTKNYTIKVTNNDIGGCTNTTFTLSTHEVSDDGDNFVDIPSLDGSAPPFNTGSLAPGASQNVTLGVTSRPGKTTGRTKTRVSSAADAYHLSVLSATATTNLNVATCTANVPQLVIGPNSGNVAVGGTLAYNVTVKNTDVGAACTSVNYTVSIVSDNPATPNLNFNASTLTYDVQGGASVIVPLLPGQTGTAVLTVSATALTVLDVENVTTISVTAAGHTAPANVTATTIKGNRLLHNSINIESTKWSGAGGWGVPGGKYGEFVCTTCHNDGYQDTNNIKRVRETISTPDGLQGNLPGHNQPIVYDRNAGTDKLQGVLGWDSAGATPRASSNKICEICHTYDAAGTNGVNAHPYATAATLGNHYNGDGTDCISCHKHKQGFKGAGGSCDNCHGATPSVFWSVDMAYGKAGNAPGAHLQHVGSDIWYGDKTVYDDANYSNAAAYNYNCRKCHDAGHSAGNDPLITLSGTSNPPSSGGSYSNATDTCATLYCHGNFTGGLNASPVWNTPASGACGTCHGAAAASPPTGGGTSHSRHAGSAGGGLALACDTCHEDTTTGSALSADLTWHVNYAANINIKRSAAIGTVATYGGGETFTKSPPSATYGSCANIYCHSNVQGADGNGAPSSFSTPAWGGSALTCSAVNCHDPMNLTTGGTGKHQKHAGTAAGSYNYLCASCHSGAGKDTTAHANYVINMSFSGTAAETSYTQGSNTPGGGYGTCSTSYCHSQGTLNASFAAPNVTAAWNATFTDPCKSCHNAAQSVTSGDATDRMATNRHLSHIDNLSAVGKRVGCQECHNATASGDTTVSSYVRHVNRLVNVKFDNAINLNTDNPTFATLSTTGADGAARTPGSATGSCSSVYCHSSGNLGTGSNIAFRTPAWNTTTTIGCDGCHGDQTGKAHPVYASGAAGAVNANSHVKHVEANLFRCDTCHLSTTADTNLPPTTVVTGALHINRSENVTFNTSKAGGSAAWTAGTKTCSTTYCHGTAGIQWGANNTLTCNSCHQSQGSGGTASYAPKHEKHVSTAFYVYSCEMCHARGNTTQPNVAHSQGKATAPETNPGGDVIGANQFAQIKFRDNGATWTTEAYGGSAVTTYKYRTLYTNPYTAAAATPTYADGASSASDTVNSSLQYTTNGSCNTVWCHSNANPRLIGAEPNRNQYRAVAWNATLTCASCHLEPAAVATMTSAADRLSTNHADHIATDRYGLQTNYTCNTCHNNTASNNNTISSFVNHANATKDVAMNTWAGGTWTAPSCSTVYCHSSATRLGITPATEYRTPSWADAAITACNVCHSNADTNANMLATTGVNRMSAAHRAHVATDRYGTPGGNSRAAGDQITCNFCHTNTASNNTTISSYTVHVNKTNNVAYNAWADPAGPNVGGYTSPNCSNTYCHSAGTTVAATTSDPSHAAVSWTTTTTCASCHGNSPAYVNQRKSPATASGANWVNPANVSASDDLYATYAVANAITNNDFLRATNFGFTAAGDATGVTVIIEGKASDATATNRQIRAALTVNGTAIVGTEKTTLQLGTADSVLVLGGANDLWSASLTQAQVIASTFGVLIRDNDNTAAGTISIDQVRVVVHTASEPKMNSHAKHTAQTCDKCHVNTTSTGTSITNYANHMNKAYNVNQGTGVTFTYAFSAAGGTCSTVSCHGNAQWGVSEMNCVTCHSAIVNKAGGGTRRAVSTEFGLAWSHKRSAGGSVTPNDCAVCHMEGTSGSNPTVSALHGNNSIDLRDPDTGTAITGFTSFTRNTASATIETWVTNVQNNLCLKCHDAGGATHASALVPGGTASRPFGTAVMNSYNQNVLDVNTQLATTNSTFHPIRGAQNNPFSNVNTMVAPWNTKAAPAAHPNQAVTNGPVMSCWDCHETLNTAHGGSITLRSTRVMQYATALGATGTFTATTNLCTACHLSTVYNSSNTADDNSAFGGVNWGTTDPPQDTAVGHGERMNFTCTTCHGSAWVSPGRPFVSDDVHGYNSNAYYKPSHLITPSFTVSGTNWTTATSANLGLSDNTYASYNNTAQNNLSVTNFAYSLTEIPDGVTITGIAVIVEGNGASADAAQRQIRLNLSKVAGTAIGTWKPAVQLNTTDTTVVFGGPTDLWGVASWTPAEIRAAGFGVLLSDNDTTAAALNIDQVRLVVYTNRWGNSASAASTTTGARPYSFLRNAAEKTATVGQGSWRSWRPRKDGAATNTAWGCSWTTAGAAAPCSRGDHVTTWISYGPGGVY